MIDPFFGTLATGALGLAGKALGGGPASTPDVINTPFDGRVLDGKSISVAPGFVIGNYSSAPVTPPLALSGKDATNFLNGSNSGISTPLGSISSDVISGVIVGLILFVLLRRKG